jgi:hypothetical protein
MRADGGPALVDQQAEEHEQPDLDGDHDLSEARLGRNEGLVGGLFDLRHVNTPGPQAAG